MTRWTHAVSYEAGSDQSTAGLSAERIGRNDAIFRNANERISDVAEAQEFEAPVPFICECADPGCREIVQINLTDYRAIREDARCFLNALGHQTAAQGWGRVVAEHANYVVVEKIGPAAQVAEQLEDHPDPANAPIDIDGRYHRDSE